MDQVLLWLAIIGVMLALLLFSIIFRFLFRRIARLEQRMDRFSHKPLKGETR